MSVFRNVIFNFKSEEDCENFLTRYKIFIEQDEKIGLETFYICRLTKDSLLIFAMIDTEENAKKLLNKSTEWRELNRFEFHDQMVLDGNLEKSWNFL